jgi:cell division protein FtsL
MGKFAKTQHRSLVLMPLLRKNGWVVLLLALFSSVYAHAVHQKRQVISELDTQLKALKTEKLRLQQTQEDLSLQIASQSDPAWIELILKKRLGLVPEGQTKVYFYE